ncbi:MAG: DNA topoisomerase VI subunit B [Planctomycetota bacterium]|nr:DNA topoisomerase VI subunit B [Planctomycetota bacterium]
MKRAPAQRRKRPASVKPRKKKTSGRNASLRRAKKGPPHSRKKRGKSSGNGTEQANLPFGESDRNGRGAPLASARPAAPATPAAPPPRATAITLGAKQREISVSEFFAKNRHLLGFDNPRKALLTAVKEAVDNSLDACEEAGIMPDLQVEIRQVRDDRYVVSVEDNGPGIVKAQIPKIFGKLLYGSKFHHLQQSRGQQGLGISAAGMYGQITTGRPIAVTSKISPRKPAQYYEISIDTQKNVPVILKEGDGELSSKGTGTRVNIELAGKYQKGKRSVDGYLEQTSLANPHARIRYVSPDGEETIFPRTAKKLPPEPKEILPHPYGVELGNLLRMMRQTRSRNLSLFLRQEFSRVSPRVAADICEKAGFTTRTRPRRLTAADAEKIHAAIEQTKIMAPPTNCLSPIGEELIVDSMKKQIPAETFVARTRPPAVYRGNPFLVECGIAFGGELPADRLVTLYRYANRVPLLYQQSACVITDTVMTTDWKNYGFQQARGALPTGPAVLFIHVASAWVPFTSESKEAIADYPEIAKEVKLALQECGREVSIHIRRRKRELDAERKQSYIEQYIPHIGIALREILEFSKEEEKKVVRTLKDVLERSRKK